MFDYSALELYKGLTDSEIKAKMRERRNKYANEAYRKALHGEKTRCVLCNTGFYVVHGLSITCSHCGHHVMFEKQLNLRSDRSMANERA